MKQYKALKPIGRFNVGDFVGGLSEAEIKHHLQRGMIAEAKPVATSKQPIKEVKTNGEK